MTNLRFQRLARDLTLDEVAALVGCTNAAVSLWERGKRRPSGVRRRALEELYGLPLDELLRPVNANGRVGSESDATA